MMHAYTEMCLLLSKLITEKGINTDERYLLLSKLIAEKGINTDEEAGMRTPCDGGVSVVEHTRRAGAPPLPGTVRVLRGLSAAGDTVLGAG